MMRSPVATAAPEGPFPSATGTFILFILLFLYIQKENFVIHSYLLHLICSEKVLKMYFSAKKSSEYGVQ